MLFRQCILIFSTAVDDSYQGPRLEKDFTPEFMKELLDWQKREKKLHRKYAYKVYAHTVNNQTSFTCIMCISCFEK